MAERPGVDTTYSATVENGRSLQNAGLIVMRVALVVALIWVGALKFTTYEAEGVHMLAMSSPIIGWGYSILTVQAFAIVLGIIEIALALMIASRPFAPAISAIGSLGVVIMSLITLSLLLTTAASWQPDMGFPFLSPMPGQFLLKDGLMLGVALLTAGEARTAAALRV